MSPDIKIKPTKRYIAFIRIRSFAFVVLRKSIINLYLNLKEGSLIDPLNLARDVSVLGHWGEGDYEIVLNENSDLVYVLSLVRQAYEKS